MLWLRIPISDLSHSEFPQEIVSSIKPTSGHPFLSIVPQLILASVLHCKIVCNEIIQINLKHSEKYRALLNEEFG